MDISIRFRCSGCNARIKAPFELVGQMRDCPGCGQRVCVRLQAPEDCGPLVVPNDFSAPSQRQAPGAV
jgi:hypothetical protein